MAKRGRKAKVYNIEKYFTDDKLREITGGQGDDIEKLKIYIETNFGKFAHSTKKIRQLEKELKEIYKDPENGYDIMMAKANWAGDKRIFNGVKVVSDRISIKEYLDENSMILEAARLSNGMYLTYQVMGNPYDTKGTSP